MNELLDNYYDILIGLKEKIRLARLKAAFAANKELLIIYWEIGSIILELQKKEGWGTKIIDKLAIDLKLEFPDFKGFSVRNLKYMRAFAEAYPDFAIVQPVVAQLQKDVSTEFVQPMAAQIPWTHHTIILDKIKAAEERIFYITKTIENNWSKNILVAQIKSDLYKRSGKAITNFEYTLPQLQSDLANETLKNPYVFDFLSFGEEIRELELEKALIQHLKKFMLELGRGFAYVGNQKNMNVSGNDYFLDLLFYNYHLRCFVVFELKVGEFEPEYAGKLNFYVNAINEQLKSDKDEPTIGVLLCKTPNETIVNYSLKGIESPIGVADYELSKILPKQLKGEIPTIEEFEAEIEKEYEELKTPAEKRLDALKQKIAALNEPEIPLEASYEILCEIFDKSLLPLFDTLINKLKDFEDLYLSTNYYWNGSDNITDINMLASYWKDEQFLKPGREFYFYYDFRQFKKAGAEIFSTRCRLHYSINRYWYGFYIYDYDHKNDYVFFKKIYSQQLTKNDISSIVETVYNYVLEQIEQKISWIENKNN